MCGWDIGVWIKGRNYGGSNFLKPLHCMHSSLDWAITSTGLAGNYAASQNCSWSIERGSTPTRSMLPLQRENRFSTKKVESNRGINRQKEMRTSLSFLFSNLRKTPHYSIQQAYFTAFTILCPVTIFLRMEVASPFHRLQKCKKGCFVESADYKIDKIISRWLREAKRGILRCE